MKEDILIFQVYIIVTLDYIFTSQDLISKKVNTEINSIKVTDHALMSIEIEIKKDYNDSKRWRMDNTILQYPEVTEKIKKE